MACTSPECRAAAADTAAEHEPRTITHTVLYRRRTLTFDRVPAEVCPECGDTRLSAETLEQIAVLLDGLEAVAPDRLRFEPA